MQPELCYTIKCLDECDAGRFVLSNAINSTQYFIVGKVPRISGLTSRHSSRQRWQASAGCFVMRSNHKPCPECGQSMHRQSKVCQKCHFKHWKQEFVIKICPVCENPFKVDKNQVKVGNGKYCGRSCARSGSPTRKRKRVKVQCANCKEYFDKKPIEAKRNKGELHFCKPECWYEFNVGENHYGYTGTTPERQALYGSTEWRWVAFQVWQRDEAKCRRCQRVKVHSGEYQLEIHHIVPFSKSVELRCEISNLVLLCNTCHDWVHSNDNVNKEFLGEIC